MLIFNLPGLAMLLIGAGASWAAATAVGSKSDGTGMVCAGPVVAALDLAYRAWWGGRRWFHPDHGGNLFYLPCWLVGAAWLVVGAYYLATGRA